MTINVFITLSIVVIYLFFVSIEGRTPFITKHHASTYQATQYRHYHHHLWIVRGGSDTTLTVTESGTIREEKENNTMSDNNRYGNNNNNNSDEILMVFSDLDGTLLHYPSDMPKSNAGNQILILPPSSTGMRGIISSKTLSLIDDIRKCGIKFVLVSGMRTSTFLKRLPYLPRADAYCTEAGGRIFYPTDNVSDKNVFVVKLRNYDGAGKHVLKPFGIVEDMEWAKLIEKSAGQYDSPDLKELERHPCSTNKLKEKDGLLWDFARNLAHKGFVLDTKGYSACFRVNKKQQTTISDEEFDSLLNGSIKPFPGLSSSINLSCIDFYPDTSGKKNCCLYLAQKFFCDSMADTVANKFVANHAVCMCDDDNDLEMAMACKHAYIPEISSQSMKDIIDKYPERFTQTGGGEKELSGTDSSEFALALILEKGMLQEQKSEQNTVAEGAA
jgi:hydroxymethylpyrimidine pyrophosphatase-like HAD family hydrolase